MKWILFGCTIIILKYIILCQDIHFPDDEEISHVSGGNATITERIPVSVPDRCPKNMLLYPGDGNISSWACDCRPRFLYYPSDDSCYEAYRQGPCEPQNYLVLPKQGAVPKCVNNPCLKDGLVRYNNICYNLRTVGGPCAPSGVLGVNETTFEVECVPTDVAPFIIINAPYRDSCPAGSRKNLLGMCKRIISNTGNA